MPRESNKLVDYRRDMSIPRGPMDVPFLLLTLLLLAIGVVMVLSASYASAYYDLFHETGGKATYFFTRQLAFAAAGIAIMLLASRFPVSLYRRFSFIILFISAVLLAAVLVMGVGNSQATRWLSIGGFSFQPSEIAKVGIILFFAHMICLYKDEMGTIKRGILPFGLILAVILGLLAAEPHLSAIIIIFAVGLMMMYVGGTKGIWFITGAALAVGFVVLAVNVFGFAADRINIWRDPFSDMRGDGFQTVQSLYAIGSGGLFGLGLGQSRQKYLYLPEEHNDFIFSIVCEELGYIGAILVLALFALLIIRGYYIALHCKNRYSLLVCVGITTQLALQVFLNVAVCTNLIPPTGISLPFFSYGGTALLIQLAEMGIILSVSRDVPVRKTSKRKALAESELAEITGGRKR